MDPRVRNLVASSRLFASTGLPDGSIDENIRQWLSDLAARCQGPSAACGELNSLRTERDPELMATGLLAFAGRHANTSVEIALEIYRGLAAAPEIFGAATANLAHARGEALQGRGDFGPRFEAFSGRFLREVTNPAALAGMAVAGGAFQGLRLVAHSRLLASPSAHFFTRGLGARGLSAGLAFAAEAPAFVATVHGVDTLLGREPVSDSILLRRELASTYLILGALRLSGAVGNAVFRRYGAATGQAGAWQRSLLQQGSMLTGIVAAQGLEEKLGLRESQGGGALLAESLATLLHFNVAGRMLHGMTGGRFTRELRLRQTALDNLPPAGNRFEWNFGLQPMPAGARPTGAAEMPEPMRMSASTEGKRLPRPLILLSEGSAPEAPWPAPVQRDPQLYIRYRDAMSHIGHNIFRIISELHTGRVLWNETSLQVTEFLLDNFEADLHRLPPEHRDTQSRLAAQLEELRINLRLLQSSGLERPSLTQAKEFLGWLYRVPNRMVNYLNSGHLNHLEASLHNAREANREFRSSFSPLYLINVDSGKTSPTMHPRGRVNRALRAGQESWSETYLPFYDFIDSVTDHLDVPPEKSRRVLLMGDIPAERAALSGIHEVGVGEAGVEVKRRLLEAMATRNPVEPPRIWFTPSPEHYDYAEAYDFMDASYLHSESGARWLERNFFQPIRPGGIGLWMSRDGQALDRVVELALQREWADVIVGTHQGMNPLRLPSRPDAERTNFVFFRKLAGK